MLGSNTQLAEEPSRQKEDPNAEAETGILGKSQEAQLTGQMEDSEKRSQRGDSRPDQVQQTRPIFPNFPGRMTSTSALCTPQAERGDNWIHTVNNQIQTTWIFSYVCVLVTQSCPASCNPMDCSRSPLSMESSR